MCSTAGSLGYVPRSPCFLLATQGGLSALPLARLPLLPRLCWLRTLSLSKERDLSLAITEPQRIPRKVATIGSCSWLRCSEPRSNVQMEAGDAAVIGAAIGAIGGLGGGLVTVLAQGRQLRMQARLERARWRDELRRDAYNACIASSKQLSAAWWKVSDQLLDDQATMDDWQASFVVAHDAWQQFSAAVSTVVVAGPRSVVEVAHSLRQSLYELDMAGLSWFRAAEREGIGRIADFECRFKAAASAKRGPERAFQQAARQALNTEH